MKRKKKKEPLVTFPKPEETHDNSVAIIGIAAYLPGARDVDALWENLKAGKCVISEVPPERWSIAEFFSPHLNENNKTYSKWGGFLHQIDKFDPLFFGISPAEAEWMDPQQRLILEVSWQALEDACCISRLDGARCGAYIGVLNNDYQEIIQRRADESSIPAGYRMLGNSNSILAARIAYLLNLKGPVVTVDTACSSSLVALHMACQSLQQREADLMLVGGVTLYLTETPYIEMSKAGMLTKGGLCKTFDNSADGFVPGEGCSVLVLKRVQDALTDGDRIYGVIRGSGINQDGKTNGITAPSAESQKELELAIYKKNNINPEDISYVEAHGTATKLGDPIEVEALTQAFKEFTQKREYCAIGSIKSNIGHTAASAGAAGIIKVLLCMQHKQLVPTLHVKEINEHIDFAKSPFYVNQSLKKWERKDNKPLLATVSSFGFSGTNAHVVIEEGIEYAVSSKQNKSAYLFTLSAKHPISLKQRILDLLDILNKNSELPVEAIAYTLNAGRMHFSHRAVCIGSSLEELKIHLNHLLKGEKTPSALQGIVFKKENDQQANQLLEELSDVEGGGYLKKLLALADLYIKGSDLNWNMLHQNEANQFIKLPGYPFLKETCWIAKAASANKNLHPLIGWNSSLLGQTIFTTEFNGSEIFLKEHLVASKPTIPGTAMIEMAIASCMIADSSKNIAALKNIIWSKPLIIDDKTVRITTHLALKNEQVNYSINGVEESEKPYSEGTILFGTKSILKNWSTFSELNGRLNHHFSHHTIYAAFSAAGLEYGKSFQLLEWVKTDGKEILGSYHFDHDIAPYHLHPCILDAALQASIGFSLTDGSISADRKLAIPFAIDSLFIADFPPKEGFIHIKGNSRLMDLKILDRQDRVCIEIRGLSLRVKGEQNAPELKYVVSESNEELLFKTIVFLKEKLAVSLKIQFDRLTEDASFGSFGIDSIQVLSITRSLEEDLGKLPKTLFFEYQNIRLLADYFVKQHAEKLNRKFGLKQDLYSIKASHLQTKKRAGNEFNDEESHDDNAVAIIGLNGCYPMAKTLEEFWENLQGGKDCVTEIPLERWDYRLDYDPNKESIGKNYGKWGGFIADFDKFDPLFFNISPREAEIMDPQERVFLETAWKTFEDAGYALYPNEKEPIGLSVGVFVGVMYGLYQLYSAEEERIGNSLVPGSSYASIANRVSHYLNLRGPSMAIDTMCSSSLTAIHLACQSLRAGECEMALAGGVNIASHRNKYLMLSQGRFLSSNGKCMSFGAGGDGYVPSEGAGAVLLKRLHKALQDGDRVYGIIRSTSINHGGMHNGYTVPSPSAQAQVVLNAFQASKIPFESISYLETHGTGTSLGDPIEIRGLSKAFGDLLPIHSCPIGSVKSNLGHLESAAGIAALTKVLMQLKHKMLVPSIHAETLNPYINFDDTPFYVQRELVDWQPKGGFPRRAGINAFGAGGSNAHILVEEWAESIPTAQKLKPYYLICLSAKQPSVLKQRIEDLYQYLANYPDLLLENIAYTLNAGRSHFEYRYAFVASSLKDLQKVLSAAREGKKSEGIMVSKIAKEQEQLFIELMQALLSGLDAYLLEPSTYLNKLKAVGDLYVKGYALDWNLLHKGESKRKISLPVYPFLRERYWISEIKQKASSTPMLHPMVGWNISTLGDFSYRTHFCGDEFYLTDHVVDGKKVLPGVAYLEMARAAGQFAHPGYRVTELQDIVWLMPLEVLEYAEAIIHLKSEKDQVGFNIQTTHAGLHCQGVIVYGQKPEIKAWRNIPLLEQQLGGDFKGEAIYQIFAKAGLEYGKAFQLLQWVKTNGDEALAYYSLPKHLSDHEGYYLHPSILDAALQATGVLGMSESLALPFSLEKIKIIKAPLSEGYIHIKKELNRYSYQILDVQNDVCIEIEGLTVRLLRKESVKRSAELIYYHSEWKTSSLNKKEKNEVKGLCLIGDEVGMLNKIYSEFSGLPMIRLFFGSSYSQIEPSTYQIRRDNQEDYISFLKHIEQTGIDLTHFIFLNHQASDFTSYLDSEMFALVQLLQSHLHVKKNRLINIVVPHFIDKHNILFAGVLTGFTRSLLQEHPGYQLQVISLESTKQLTNLIEEMNYGKDICVRYVKEGREVETFIPSEKANMDALPIKKNHVYLITGGLGGLGLIIARDLAKNFNARMILTGRSELDEEKKKVLSELENLGGKALYFSGDVSHFETVEQWINEAKNSFGCLNGIIHSAGILDDSFFVHKQWKRFRSVILPKGLGAINLDLAASKENLDCFILFSSVASCFGNIGQTDYAAGNAFLDSFAVWREEQRRVGNRHGKSVSINWPYWEEGGMRINEETILGMRNIGLESLPSENGLEAFYNCLKSSYPQSVVLYGNKMIIEKLIIKEKIETPSEMKVNSQEKLLRLLIKEIGVAASDILKLRSEIEYTKDLTNYGFDSVTFTQLANQLKKIYGFSVTPALFFEFPTIEAIANYFCQKHSKELINHYPEEAVNKEGSIPSPIESKTSNSFLPLSIGQQQLYSIYLMDQQAVNYNVGMAVKLKGDLKIDVLKKAVSSVIARQDVLRSIFSVTEGDIKATIVPHLNFDIDIVKGDKKSIEEIIRQFHEIPFDLKKGPCLRCCLVCLEEDFVFITVMHHIVTDGWSLGLFNKDIIECYNQHLLNHEYKNRQLAAQYQDFVSWQKMLSSESEEEILEFWQKQLTDLSEPLRLPHVSKSIEKAHQDGEEHLVLDKKLVDQVRLFAQSQGVSLFICLFSAYQLLLARYSGTNDIVVGVPFFGREKEEYQETIGYFINILPFRAKLSPFLTFQGLVKQNQTLLFSAQKYQTLSLTKLMKNLKLSRSQAKNPLFQVLFNYAHIPLPDQQLSGVESQLIWSEEGQTDYELTMRVVEQQGKLELILKYDSSLFDCEFIQYMLLNYQTLLENVIKHHESIWIVELLNVKEKQRMLIEWNQTAREYSENWLLHQLFEEQAAKNPNQIAISYEGQQLTYQELNVKANQLARYLQVQGVKRNILVAISFDRSLELVIGVLAILKAGAAYVPIDPHYPMERIQFILNDGKIKYLLTQDILSDMEVDGLMFIDLKKINYAHGNGENCKTFNQPLDLAYVIYTSGTTGQPKGVMIPHAAIVNTIYAEMEQFPITAQSKVLQFASISFDASVWEVFGALSSGGHLVLCPQERLIPGEILIETLERENITVVILPPAALKVTALKENLPLKTLVLGGEACSEDLIKKWAPFYRLINAYGPTENSICSTAIVCNRNSKPYIGKPIPNVEVYVLDPNLQPVPIGVIGELHLGGAGLARGYLYRKELTEEKFIKNPFKEGRLYKTGDLVRWQSDGNLEYIGRNDFQVKIRGYRIELGEIESVLSKYHKIKQTIVLAKERNHDASKFLIAYYVSEGTISNEDLNHYLSLRLPDYLIPHHFIHLDKIPLTFNGKIDRKALPDVHNKVEEKRLLLPRTSLEKKLCSIWQELIGVSLIGITDDFFMIGGDSILAIQLISKLRDNQLQCSVKDVFDYPTIEKLAKRCVVHSDNIHIKTEEGLLSGSFGFLPIQQWFFEQSFPRENHWNQSFLVKVPLIDVTALTHMFGKLADHHDILRTSFNSGSGLQYYHKEIELPKVNVLDRSKLTQEELELTFAEWQRGFDIKKSPLWQVGYVYGYEDGSARLFFAFHHLIMDTVSWRILIEDAKAILEGKELTKKTSSYRQWVNVIDSYAQNHESETIYWEGQIQGQIDYTRGPDVSTNEHASHFKLDRNSTFLLIQRANQAYHTEINDLLLTALAFALQAWHGSEISHITLEGHGREHLDDNIDISRTVGWFTTMFPVKLFLEKDLGSTIKTIKENLRKIPIKGIGYGVFRKRFNHQLPAISFNYLGKFESKENGWQIVAENSGTCIHPSNMNLNVLNFNGILIDGEIQFIVNSRLTRSAAKKVLDAFQKKLMEIISHCIEKIEKQETEFTPSDFRGSYEPVTIINSDAHGAPLILLPPGEFGSEAYLRTLCPFIFKTTKMILLDNYLFKKGDEKKFKSYHEIAKHYIEILSEHKVLENLSECYLGGWSMGGILAYEVMLELENLNIKVIDNFLIDPIVPSLLGKDYRSHDFPFYSLDYTPDKTSNKITLFRCAQYDKTLPLTTLAVDVPYLGFDKLTVNIDEVVLECPHRTVLTDSNSLKEIVAQFNRIISNKIEAAS